MTHPTFYLVDTNSYVRIARSSGCILGDHAGLKLRLLEEIATECNRSTRLQQLCTWLQEPPHPETRQLWTWAPSKVEAQAIKDAKTNSKQYVEDALEEFAERRLKRGDTRPVLSTPDKAVFFTAYAMQFGLITDEGALTKVCKEFDVPHLTTLELLLHLTESNLLARSQVEAMVRYWLYEKDEPRDWKAQYRKLFGSPVPALP